MKTHCPQQHEFTEENTYTDKNGYRHCKACRRARMEKRRAGGPGQGAHNAAKTHCPHNHEYTEENTWVDKKGSRHCRTCARMNGALQNLKRYNMTPEKLQEMMAAQGNKCLICPRTFAEFVPHIDHDHTCCPGGGSCGKCIRGLLCVDCNRGLGSFRDSADLLRAAADYLG